MGKRTVALVGAITALAAVGAAAPQVATATAPARSFAELLDPIPNASEQLAMADAQGPDGGQLILVVERHGHHAMPARHRRHHHRPPRHQHRHHHTT